MKLKLVFVLLIILSSTQSLSAFQINLENLLDTRFSIKFGLTNTVLKDEYISKEKYSDSYPFIAFGITQMWAGKINEIVLSHGNTETLANNNLESWYEYTTLNFNLLYPLRLVPNDSNSSVIYLGPSISYYSYNFSHTFAIASGYESEGSLLSLGISSKFIYALYPKFKIEVALSTSLVSIAEKTFDNQKYPDFEGTSARTTILETGIIDFGTKIRIPVFNKFKLFLGYDLKYIRIGDWDNYNSLNNLFFVEISYDI